MAEINKQPDLKFETVTDCKEQLAIDFLRQNLSDNGQSKLLNGRWPRWGKTYDDGSILRLFLDNQKNIEIGYYSWPPMDYLAPGHNQNHLDHHAMATAVFHEFFPNWYRSNNLLYADDNHRPRHIASSQAYGVYRDHRYMHENFSPVFNSGPQDYSSNGQTARLRARSYALEAVSKAGLEPLSVPPGERLVGNGRSLTPCLTDWLRPIMRDHHQQSQPANIRVGYYSFIDDSQIKETKIEDRFCRDRQLSSIGARIISEFMPGWQLESDCLVPANVKSGPSQQAEDGYHLYRRFRSEYLAKIDPQGQESAQISRYWANLRVLQMRDEALLKPKDSPCSLPYDIIKSPAAIWTRTYSDGSQLRIVYEANLEFASTRLAVWKRLVATGQNIVISSQRRQISDLIATELSSRGAISPPPQEMADPILQALPLGEFSENNGAFSWLDVAPPPLPRT